MQSGCQSNDVKSNALATIDRAEKSDVTKIQREAIGMWGSGLSGAVQIKANLRESIIDGAQIITKQDRAPDDATGMIEVLSQQLRNL